jgi:CheY-like chemotaxis protein
MKEFQAANPNLDSDLIAMVKANIDAAETIQLCAGHQKNIVNDILTISKLDSNLLLITPVPVQPIKIMHQCLKMFKSELEIADIKMEFHIDCSFHELRAGTVMLDSSRLLQVLINLLTNAIKFTKSEKKRSIDVTLSAHLEPPTEGISNFQYFPTKKVRSDFITGGDWGNGDILYLRWEVRDTGCGITENEKKNLFTRFSQASPRTHVQYGGSGLGLFISRQLTELQGGEIGVASEAGVGSTFAFYLKSRRAEGEVSEAAEKRLSADLQTNARLATNVPKELREHDPGIQKLLRYNNNEAALAATSSSPAENARLNSADWHVLIVEDNLVNQRILAEQMRKLGCTVHVANHGEEALSLLRETRYSRGREGAGLLELSVILMDLEMPVMDGLTCVRRIREMEARGELGRRIPIIAVTANARGEQIAAAKDSGMVSAAFLLSVFGGERGTLLIGNKTGRRDAETLPDQTAGAEDRGAVDEE